jgi:hypothetical protein
MRFLERQLSDPSGVTRIKRWFYTALALIAVGEILGPYFVEMDPAHFWYEDFPAWGSLYGLVSCVVIIVVSKLLGKLWLMRREDHYDS